MKRIIAVDFDGTCVTHEYPKIGKDIGAAEVLKKLTDGGDRIILFTMRSGELLQEAQQWFADRNIPLFGVNKNPTQWPWTKSPKPHANIYIDDAGLGCPTKYNPELSARPYVNWEEVAKLLGVE